LTAHSALALAQAALLATAGKLPGQLSKQAANLQATRLPLQQSQRI